MIGIDLAGATAIVTGGSNGIGAGCVSALQRAGARVISVDLIDPVASAPDVAIRGDITDPVVRAAALSEAGDAPKILVNNAGLQLEQRLTASSLHDLERLFAVNVFAMVELTKAFAVVAAPQSVIINMGSILGLTGDPALAVYSITKGAVTNFTRTAALEYAGRIRVNAVVPGAIRTPLTTRAWDDTGDPVEAERRMTAIYPVGRIGEPEDVGVLVAFLASPLASFITGALVHVDGGVLAAHPEWALERL
jgi:NAD(P)-dependent dehydrogenase (short-subunit alcohol dehydrogenase family)